MSQSAPSAHQRIAIEQPWYLGFVCAFVAIIWFAQWLIPAGLFCLVHGAPRFEDAFVADVPDFSHAVLWQGDFWYSVMKVGSDQSSGKATLVAVDPVSGHSKESRIHIPFQSGLLADGNRLWAVSSETVVRIEGDVATEFRPKRFIGQSRIGQTCEPFLYDGHLAVIESTSQGSLSLLVFDNDEWTERGTPSAPINHETKIVDGKTVLVPSTQGLVVGTGAPSFHVTTQGGRVHALFYDGEFVAYSDGIKIAPVSADSPANGVAENDAGDADGWEVVLAKSPDPIDLLRIVLIAEEPCIVVSTANSAVPLKVFRRRNGEWQQIAAKTMPMSVAEVVAVSDGQKAFLAEKSYLDALTFHEVSLPDIQPTGTVVKAADTPFDETVMKWDRLYQWIFWPTLLALGIGVSWLMTVYLDPHFRSGSTQVEFASLTRRGIARVIDYFTYVISIYALLWAAGFGSSIRSTVDVYSLLLFFAEEPESTASRVVWTAFGCFLLGFCLLIVHSAFQGLYGVTLGKWICGIRTVRTNLRSCGFARSLVRELLILADTLFVMTWLPVTLLMAFTRNRQRFGDFVADTIVIRTKGTDPIFSTAGQRKNRDEPN